MTVPRAGCDAVVHRAAVGRQDDHRPRAGRRLAPTGRRVEVLDGDEVRPHLSAGLGFSRADRDTNVQPDRLGRPAAGLARRDRAGAGDRAVRGRPRRRSASDHAAAGVPFAEVFVVDPARGAPSRDVKGLYAKARRGELSGMTGVDDPYEEPAHAPSCGSTPPASTWRRPSSCLHALLTGDRCDDGRLP